MPYCPTCSQEIKPAPPEALRTERKYVKIPSPDTFRILCNMILRSPNCTDQKFRGALEDMPKSLHKYGQLTEGQWKFFCAIHKSVLNTWPPKPEAIVDAPPEEHSAVLSDIPF